MKQLSKEDLRAARLLAISGSPSPGPSKRPEESASERDGKKHQTSQETTTGSINHFAAQSQLDPRLWRVLCEGGGGVGGATNEDMARWFNQGFTFAAEHFAAGLKQENGGPCGVLAVVQAELLVSLLFDDNDRGDSSAAWEVSSKLDPELISAAFVRALAAIILRASHGESIVMVGVSSSVEEPAGPSDLVSIALQSHDQVAAFIADHLVAFKSNVGCLLFLLSVMATRRFENLVTDMDECDRTMIGRFGMTTQEAINLLLTGRATTNVFDGSIPLGESGLVLRGVAQRSKVGYLTQMESLRLLKVGSHLKMPQHPVWVVGSSTHFTVLFSRDRRTNSESDEEAILSRVQRAFKEVDAEQCGFILADSLDKVLLKLGLLPSNDPTYLSRLRSHITIESDVILWSSFWESASRLLSGVSLTEVISSKRSDSEIARQLQAESGPQSRSRSDSDLARELQASWDKEDGVLSSETKEDVDRSELHRNDSIADGKGEGLVLYLYNGLESAQHPVRLWTFQMHPRTSVDSIGQLIALDESFSSGGSVCEEILRTRWPGCRVDWLGSGPPSLD